MGADAGCQDLRAFQLKKAGKTLGSGLSGTAARLNTLGVDVNEMGLWLMVEAGAKIGRRLPTSVSIVAAM
jgi:hypothetical protein